MEKEAVQLILGLRPEIFQSIVAALILIGIFYVAFVMTKALIVKNGLLKYLKDYEEVMKKHVDRKVEVSKIEAAEEKEKEMLAKLDEEIKIKEEETEKIKDRYKNTIEQLYRFMVYLILDLDAHPRILEEYIPNYLSDKLAKHVTKVSYAIAREVLED